jgi:hypothetical protein
VSYRTALDAGLHRNLSEVLIPNVLLHYDTSDLITAIHPRQVTLINPANAMGQVMRDPLARAALASVVESDRRLKTPNRVRLLRRGPGDPLPIP